MTTNISLLRAVSLVEAGFSAAECKGELSEHGVHRLLSSRHLAVIFSLLTSVNLLCFIAHGHELNGDGSPDLSMECNGLDE